MEVRVDAFIPGLEFPELNRLDVPQRDQVITLADLPSMAGAVVMNSWTLGVAVYRIGALTLPEAPGFLPLLYRAYEIEIPTSPAVPGASFR